MGFTRYFETHKNGIPVAAWKKILSDTRKLLSNLPTHSTNAGGYYSDDPLEIAFEDDQPNKAPEVSDSLIRFNGKGNLGHETFYFERKPEMPDYQKEDGNKTVFAFCKTARKPYDLVVCGVLIVAAKHAGRYVTVSSDGDLSDWMPAFEWVTSILGPEYAASAVAARLKGGDFQLGGVPEDESAEVPRGTSAPVQVGAL